MSDSRAGTIEEPAQRFVHERERSVRGVPHDRRRGAVHKGLVVRGGGGVRRFGALPFGQRHRHRQDDECGGGAENPEHEHLVEIGGSCP